MKKVGRSSDFLLPLPASVDTSKGRIKPTVPPAVPQCNMGLTGTDHQMDPVVGRGRGKAGHFRNVTESPEGPGQLWLPWAQSSILEESEL